MFVSLLIRKILSACNEQLGRSGVNIFILGKHDIWDCKRNIKNFKNDKNGLKSHDDSKDTPPPLANFPDIEEACIQ